MQAMHAMLHQGVKQTEFEKHTVLDFDPVRAQELCETESHGGGPGLPVPNGLCGCNCKATLN